MTRYIVILFDGCTHFAFVFVSVLWNLDIKQSTRMTIALLNDRVSPRCDDNIIHTTDARFTRRHAYVIDVSLLQSIDPGGRGAN